MTYTKEIKQGIEYFPAVPSLCKTILGRINDPDLDIAVILEEFRFDPGMTANILRLTNSAFFRGIGKITSLQQAVVRLGMRRLFQLVVASGVAQSLRTDLKGYDLEAAGLMRHSAWVAVAAEELAKEINAPNIDMLFTAGLLHDLGKIILDEFIIQEKDTLLAAYNADPKHESFDHLEEQILGMSHQQAGGILLEKWEFPQELQEIVTFHHCPEKAPNYQQMATVVHVADILAYTEGVGTGIDGLHYKLSDEAVLRMGITHLTLERVAGRTLDRMQQLQKMLESVA